MFTSLHLSLLALAVFLTQAAGLIVRFVRPDWLASRAVARGGAFLFGGGAALLVVIELCRRASGSPTGFITIPVETLLVPVVSALLCGLFLSLDAWRLKDVSPVRQPIVWGAFLAVTGLGVWSFHLFETSCQPRRLISFDAIAQGQLHHVDEVYGETDLGRPIELLRFEDLSPADSETIELTPSRGGVSRSRPSVRTNCHGWVFTAGLHFVSGSTVDEILTDNGYEPVLDPAPGDLVIYRDDDGEILHSGIVRGRLDDGVVIIESKFGIGGRFLHLPEDQPYTRQFEYYRTPRGGHVITIRHGAPRGIVGPARVAERPRDSA